MIPSRATRLLTLIALLSVYSAFQTAAQQNKDSRVFNINVADVDGKPYPGLKPEHFSAWVDKAPRKITALSFENGPLSVGILIDASDSFRPLKKDPNEFSRKIYEGITRFLEASNPENEYFAATFDARVAISERWTGAKGPRLQELSEPGDRKGTVLFDAIHFGVQQLANARHERHVILVISDGVDNHSKQTYKQIEELLKRSDVTLFSIAVYDDNETLSSGEGLSVLDDLCKLSGGRALFVRYGEKAKVMNDAFDIVAANLQNQYRLSIENPDAAGPEKWRKLKLKLKLPEEKGRPQLSIWNRPGYYQ